MAPGDGADADTLLKHADLALYQRQGGGRRHLPLLRSRDERARPGAPPARNATCGARSRDGEFELYFQPLFDLETNRIGAFEALIRWNHPTRGLVAPDEFIPLAEETGLIVPIGAWVIQEACRQATNWPEDVRVAVNVSSVQFRKPGLDRSPDPGAGGERPRSQAARGRDHRIDLPRKLGGDCSPCSTRCASLGIRIALDDFGTGYSSLSYLQSFPFDKIKIDRSFIQQLLSRSGSTAIVRAITDLARALGMETTAEGVENSEQLAELRAAGLLVGPGLSVQPAGQRRRRAEALADEARRPRRRLKIPLGPGLAGRRSAAYSAAP